MTKDEAKHLQKGDLILVRTRVISVPATGEHVIYEKRCHDAGKEKFTMVDPEYVTLLKAEPERRFIIGDAVMACTVKGRAYPSLKDGAKYFVLRNEEQDGMLWVEDADGCSINAPAVFFELITPAPTFIVDPETTTDILRHGEWYAYMGDADEAEALCNILNGNNKND